MSRPLTRDIRTAEQGTACRRGEIPRGGQVPKKEARGMLQAAPARKPGRFSQFWGRLRLDFKRNRALYLLAIPVVAYYLIFCYLPMYGASIAFKDFSAGRGILGSPWAGFKHFAAFFQDIYFFRILRNTVLINLYQLIFAFPIPVLLALLINEIRSLRFKKTVQTVIYMPHFISVMVICGLILDFTARNGLINDVIALFGGERTNIMLEASLFKPVYVLSGIWQEAGWGTIIYLAALTGVDQELYEAARIDGAGRLRQMLSITIPCIMPTVVIMLILRIGNMMNVGFEKIILLYNPTIYETSDVISSYVYRKGLLDFNYSFSAAVGLFNSAINFALVLAANRISRAVNETSLW